MELDIQVIQTQHPKQKPEDESSLGFGRLFTDHMFLVEYTPFPVRSRYRI